MKARLSKENIAARAAREFMDGAYINLGIGIPNLCSRFVMPGVTIFLHAENGMLGYGPMVRDYVKENASPDYVDAGSNVVNFKKGMCIIDFALSFDIVRGRHLDFSVMGALEVSEFGDLANWTRGGNTAGVGGSVDLAIGAKNVLICMEHVTKKGEFKILKKCNLPLTGLKCVKKIFTDIAVIDVTVKGLLLREYAPGWTVEEIRALTEPQLSIAEDIKEIQIEG